MKALKRNLSIIRFHLVIVMVIIMIMLCLCKNTATKYLIGEFVLNKLEISSSTLIHETHHIMHLYKFKNVFKIINKI